MATTSYTDPNDDTWHNATSSPTGPVKNSLADYANYQTAIKNGSWVDGQDSADTGPLWSSLGWVSDHLLPIIVIAATAAGGASLLGAEAAGAAGGASSGAGAGATAGGLGDLTAAGLGDMAIDTSALGMNGAGWAGYGGLGADAAAGGATLGTLGSEIGVQGGAPAIVNVTGTAGGATTGGGLGNLGAGAVTAGGLGSMIGTQGGDPAVVNVGPPTPTDPATTGGSSTPPGPLSPIAITAGGVGAGALLNSLANGTDPTTGAPGPTNQQTAPGDPNTNYTPAPVTPPGTPGPSTIPGLGNLPDWLKGLTSLLGGNVDRIHSQQDADWWKSQLDTLNGMYQPGTPEATLMQQKMEAEDAATGRRSQYGTRETNLAAMLADKRANIMTSAGYQNMANAYRNRSSQDLNGLFGALGNSSTQNLLSSAGTSLYNMFNPQQPPAG